MNESEQNLRSQHKMRYPDYSISKLPGLGFALNSWPLTVGRWRMTADGY